MKKIFVPIILIIVLQSYYILKLRHDLSIKTQYKEFEYTKLPNDELPEPGNCEDIVTRIEMLKNHLELGYNPSKTWIIDVLTSAKINLGM
jgi:hypothetical protein